MYPPKFCYAGYKTSAIYPVFFDIKFDRNKISIFVANSWISEIKYASRLLVYGIGAKVVSNWEQNMLYTKIRNVYVEKWYLC